MSRNTHRASAVLAALIITLAAPGVADDFELVWWSIDGGGEMHCTGGEFELSGTIGQPDASTTVMSGGDFTLGGGFAPDAEPFCPGDLDGDNDTDQSDLGILLADWGCDDPVNGCDGDLNGDDKTDQSDLGILLADWGCVP